MEDKSTRKIASAGLNTGSIEDSHPPPSLTTRIKSLARVFAHVNRQSLKRWEEFFFRSQNAEQEVTVWEAMAVVYSAFTEERYLSTVESKEAFQILLLGSKNNKEAALEEARRLSQADAASLLVSLQEALGTPGVAFRSPSVSFPQSDRFEMNKPVAPSAQKSEENVTIRGEAHNGYDDLIAQTPIPDTMKQLKRIGAEDLVVGRLYLRFDGSFARRLDAIEGETVHCRDDLGVIKMSKKSFIKLHPALAPEGTMFPEEEAPGGEFTIRDEANALTALAFRNGFIEELHAGKYSPLLDQPGLSRITDEEMRCLMIEASEKLARMLRLKQSDPRRYDAEIRQYNEMYCEKWKRE